METVKWKQYRVTGSKNKHTLAEVVAQNLSLEAKIAELREQQDTDTKKLDKLLFLLGEGSARALLGKTEEPE